MVDAVIMKDCCSRPGVAALSPLKLKNLNRVMAEANHELNGRHVDVKRAIPEDVIAINTNNRATYCDQPGNNFVYDPRFQIIPAPIGGGQYPYRTSIYSGAFSMPVDGRPGFPLAPQSDPRTYAYGPVLTGPVPYSFTYGCSGFLLPYTNNGFNTNFHHNGSLEGNVVAVMNPFADPNGYLPFKRAITTVTYANKCSRF